MNVAEHTDPQGHGFEGRVLGGFRMLREIACGGMATVYLAHRAGASGFGQTAAVKVIHPHLARDREFVEMFLDEARIVSCINHPNVCRVLDFGKAEGTYYLAMEYVMGETWGDVLSVLKHRPNAQSMIPAILAQVLAQACEGLHAAHEARDAEGRPLSIVHRDISPQNLIVGYDGSVRVLDFGIASAAERLHTTRNGTIKGRFAYMAPEQMRGMPVDRRADLWSLGVVLWEGLAQRRLFKRDTEAETVLAVTQDPLPSLQEVGHPVPSSMARVALQALSRDRESRYKSARELGLELSRFAGSSMVPVGMAEVSLWMNKLFAQRIEQKRVILREAARAPEGDKRVLPSLPPAIGVDSGRITSVKGESEAPGQHVSSGLPSISTVREVNRSSLAELQRHKGLLGPLLGGLAFLSVAILGILAVSSLRGAPVPPPLPTPVLEQQQASARGVQEPANAASNLASTALAAPAPSAQRAGELEGAPEQQPEAASDSSAPIFAARTQRAPRAAPARSPAQVEAKLAPQKKKPAEAESPRPSSAGTGAVNVATPGGWAEVYVGSRKLGTTPGRFELPAGAHVLRLRPFGKGPDITRKVEVTRDGALKLKIPLE